MSQPRIFVSHSHKDDEFTQRLVDDLYRAGAEVWVDVAGITHGNFMQRIDEALAQCEWMVLVLTPNAIASPYVKDEVYAALHRVKQGYMHDVIPVLAALCAPGTVPPQWDVLHRYDATSDYATALAGALHAVGLPDSPIAVAPSTPEAADPERIRDSTGLELWRVLMTRGGLSYDEELLAYDRLLAADPTYSDAWISKGLICQRRGRYEESLVAFDQLLALSPNFALAWVTKGEVLQSLHRHKEAVAAFDRAIAIAAMDDRAAIQGKAWWNKAASLRALGREAEAEEAERRADELLAGKEWPELEGTETLATMPELLWLSKGDALLRDGQAEGALAAYELALADSPREPRATCGKVGKARIMRGVQACARIQPTCENALSGWWPRVGPCEKPPGALG